MLFQVREFFIVLQKLQISFHVWGKEASLAGKIQLAQVGSGGWSVNPLGIISGWGKFERKD